MKKRRIISIAIALIFTLSSLSMVTEGAFAANPIPNYCKSYKAIGAVMDKNLLAHKKSFKITVKRKHTDFLYPHIMHNHRVVDPYSIIRAGEELSMRQSYSIVVKNNVVYYVFTLTPKYKHSKKYDKKLYKKVRSVAKKAKRIKSKKKRVKYINNYLTGNTRYVAKYRTAYDALIRGKGNCAAYSEAFTLIACHSGLKAETVVGYFKQGKKRAAHAWNIVKVGKKWYNLDVTFNDQRQSWAKNRFLLVKNKKFKKTHQLLPGYKKIKGWTKSHPMY